jgi:hypothetical protein
MIDLDDLSNIDLDDLSNCPLGEECSACGNGDDLFLVSVSSLVGVYCTTLCPLCTWRATTLGSISAVAAVQHTLQHCGHLGITADQMEQALREEEETWPGSR